ncbi:MAG: DnaJ domain-containing protein [Desulfotignum sp.]|nr:DnaJ domain-containing protein [Desulfotignum sp.]MCF8124721.1 DnaJ domain-containing protein [Desulfotignum sp.]
MSFFFKIMLILLGLAYLIAPVDIIPEILVPFLGWVDDGLVLYCIFYLIRYGRLPWFFSKRNQRDGFGSRTTAGNQKFTSNANSSQPPEPAHEVLGVAKDASWEEIQSAYKQQIKKYHPDKLSHLGKEFSDLAARRFVEIQKAFESLKRKKGR